MNLLLAIAAAAAAQASQPLSLREARGLSPSELATRVLGTAGSHYREARVSDGGGPFGYSGIGTVQFASAPRSAGSPGLCVADILSVEFAWGWNGRTGEDRPRRPVRPESRRVYRIVGDANDRRAWTSESERALNAQCARTGPVFAEVPDARFFDRPDGTNVDMAARMLQAVIAEARQGPVSQVTCAEDPAEPLAQACADPRTILAGLPVDRLTSVLINRCATNPGHLCANLTFELSGSNFEWQELRLGIEVDVAQADPPPSTFRIVAVAIQYQTVAV